MSPTLAQRNLFYRQPDAYDRARGLGPDEELARLLGDLVARHAPGATSLLDLGCGTGRDIESLGGRFSCVGVDVQPQMVGYARRARPGLDIRIGDMRTFRLGRRVDVILCIGSALAYLHDNDDLQAAFATFAAHAHRGTLLVICTQVAPNLPASLPPLRIDTAGLHGTRTTRFDWDLAAQVNTMYRDWRLDDGTEHHDTIAWRVTGPRELELYATHAGFGALETFASPDRRGDTLEEAATAWFVARFD